MPLTEKGSEIMSNMRNQYGSEKKAKQVFYASKNAGKISGVDAQDLPLQNLMDKMMQKFASKDWRTRDQANVPTQPTGKKNDTMGTITSGDEDEPSGGSAREAPPIRYQGKELKDLGTRISGDAKRAFFKGAFKDARRFLPIGDAFKYALDQVSSAEEAPPMRPTGDRAAQLRWAMDQVGMSIPKPEGAQRAVKAPKATTTGRDARAKLRTALKRIRH